MPNRSHSALLRDMPVLAGSLALAVTLTWTASALAQRTPAPDADPRIQKLVASVSEQRLRELDTKLGTQVRLSNSHTAHPSMPS